VRVGGPLPHFRWRSLYFDLSRDLHVGSVLGMLPASLHAEVATYLYRDVLAKVSLALPFAMYAY